MFAEVLKNDSEWENFINVTPGSTFYHSLKWKEVIESSFPVNTLYLTVRNDDGRLVGIYPACILTKASTRVLDSLPFSDFGGPVFEKRTEEQACTILYRTIDEFCRRNSVSLAEICLECGRSYENFFKSSRSYVTTNKGVVYLDLMSRSSDMVWKSLASKQRQKIRKLEKNGFTVREASNKTDLKTFLSLYHQNMQYLGVPGFGPDFFENVWDILYPQNFTILFAEMKTSLGGVAFFKYDKTIYLTYFGMDRESLQHIPAVAPFLFWKAINWAEKNGFTTVCFGSTPAQPKSMGEKANYSQKMAFGGSFQTQETIYVPFDSRSFITTLLAPKATRTWKRIRNVWPRRLQKLIEHQLGVIFEA
jgi:hypothetical protein